MEEIKRYILQQVLAGQLSKSDAKQMLKRLGNARSSMYEPVAVIGLSCRFPGAQNAEEFWQNLRAGVNSVAEIPRARIDDYANLHLTRPDIDLNFSGIRGGVLREIDKFDAPFFRISPKEAEYMEPVQRLFLETCYEAMEDAGYGGNSLTGTNTGVFVGHDHSIPSFYKHLTMPDQMNLTGSYSCILANRISYIFNFKGPALVVDTACSSGAVAVHQACTSLKEEECDMAIAGGATIVYSSWVKNDHSALGMFESPDGLLRAFDKNANGTIGGEGVAALLLKPLYRALRDRDNIHAVIIGSGINNDGESKGITAPNPEAQEQILLSTWEKSGINPETISYIEAHGTGTPIGDSIEIQGLVNAFRKHTPKIRFCGLGSVKTNIGHTVAASGIANIIKVILSIKNREIPPTLNFSEPHPYINVTDSPLYINDKLLQWQANGTKRRAGINSFGFSGTNCHIVLEEAPESVNDTMESKTPKVLAISARSKKILKEYIVKYIDFLQQHKEISLNDMCYTANTGRGHYNVRSAFIFSTAEELLSGLSNFLDNGLKKNVRDGIFYGEISSRNSPGINFHSGTVEITAGTTGEETRGQTWQEQDTNPVPEALCDAYVMGSDVNWNELYKDKKFKRISIPVYPLERLRYWPEKMKGENGSKGNNKSGSPAVSNAGLPENLEVPGNDTEIILHGRIDGQYTETEKLLGLLWKVVLGINEVNVDENFHDLGGDSLQATKAANLLNKHLSIKMDMSDILKYPTLREFAAFLDKQVE